MFAYGRGDSFDDDLITTWFRDVLRGVEKCPRVAAWVVSWVGMCCLTHLRIDIVDDREEKKLEDMDCVSRQNMDVILSTFEVCDKVWYGIAPGRVCKGEVTKLQSQ